MRGPDQCTQKDLAQSYDMNEPRASARAAFRFDRRLRIAHGHIARAIGIFWAVAACLGASVSIPTARHRILIPADQPVSIVEPMRVDVLNDAGDRGLRIPDGVGRGWRREAAGSAAYTCHVPADGSYTLWAYCLWGGPCTNAVYARIDRAPNVILGNDPHYGLWHWVRGTSWPLTRGTHTLTLSNHSDGIAIQRFLLLSDPTDRPDDGAASYDLFYDGFDGCDGGNIEVWALADKRWQVVRSPGETDPARRVLAGEAPTIGAPIVAAVGQADWANYSLNLRVRAAAPGRIAIGLNYSDWDNCVLVEWCSRGPGSSSARVRVNRRTGGRSVLLAEDESSLELGRWQEVSLAVDRGQLRVRLDAAMVAQAPFDGPIAGRLALVLAEGASACFDDLHVQMTDPPRVSVDREMARNTGVDCAASRCKR